MNESLKNKIIFLQNKFGFYHIIVTFTSHFSIQYFF